MFGYRGKIVNVDLSNGSTSVTSLDEDLLRSFIGGAGLGARLLYDMIDSETDPLSPQNPLLYLTGPLCGTMAPTGSKSTFCSRSPKTGILGYSTVGGHLGADLKFAGYDGIIITGASEKPCYLLIENSDVEIRDANHLWGKNTEEVWEELKSQAQAYIRIGKGNNLLKLLLYP